MEIPKIKTRLEVKLDAGKPATMYLYGVIRPAYPWEEDGDCISANGVLKELRKLSGQAIDVHINSGGGDVFESVTICNLFKQHDGEVNVIIDGRAGSGASVIATAGKNVYMHPNCMQMIHNAWTIAAGNAKELRKAADDLDKISEAACASYKSRFVGTKEELQQLLDAETWLTAEECLTFGLCTEILADEESPSTDVKQSLLAKYSTNRPGDGTKPSLFNVFKK